MGLLSGVHLPVSQKKKRVESEGRCCFFLKNCPHFAPLIFFFFFFFSFSFCHFCSLQLWLTPQIGAAVAVAVLLVLFLARKLRDNKQSVFSLGHGTRDVQKHTLDAENYVKLFSKQSEQHRLENYEVNEIRRERERKKKFEFFFFFFFFFFVFRLW